MLLHSITQRPTSKAISEPWFVFFATILIGWNMLIAYVMIYKLHMNDFGKFYYSIVAYLDGQNMYGPNPATLLEVTSGYFLEYWNLNPPHFHLLILPLGFLSPLMALGGWTVMSFMAGLASLRLIAKNFPHNFAYTHRRIIFLAALAFSGTGIFFITAQLSLILLFPFTLAWIQARNGHWRQTGILLGLVCSIKPFFLVFVPYLFLKRQYHALVNFFLTCGVLYLAGFIIFGKQAHLQWIEKLGTINWYWSTINGSILGFLTRTFSQNPLFAPVIDVPELIIALWLLLGGTIGALTSWVLYFDYSKQAVDRAFLLLLLASLLISPLGWQYCMFFSLGPLSTMIFSWRVDLEKQISVGKLSQYTARNILLFLSIPGLVFPVFGVKLFQPSPLATVLLGSVYFWSILCLWSSMIVDGWKKNPKSSNAFS